MQRIAIMDYLINHKTHPTADEIFVDLNKLYPTLSKTTIYNTLKLFTENGAVLTLNIDEKNVRFDGDTSNHAHMQCTRCGKVYDLNIKHEYSKVSDRVTISFGVSTAYVGTKKDYNDYIKKADEALYISKEKGRNTYTHI